MKMGAWRYSHIILLTLALDGGEWSASHPCHFTPRETAAGTHCIGGWVFWRKKKSIGPARNQTLTPQPSCYTD
jgi:hypothetical protein